MNVPPLDLKSEFRQIAPEICRRINQIFQSGRFILGKEVINFESGFAKFVGAKFTVGVASGTDALLLGLMAFDVKPGDEIITTPFSFISTATVIARLGAKPVFVDIDPQTFNLNPALIKRKITKRTRGIIPVHLYGNPAEMDQIMKMARQYKLFVIEDCAQACGARLGRESVGTFGDVGAFSFYPTKTLGAAGDAGAVTTNDRNIYEKIKSLRQHGEDGKFHSYRHPLIGTNSRLDEIQAAVLNVKLKHLKKWNEARRRAAERYDQLLSAVIARQQSKRSRSSPQSWRNPSGRISPRFLADNPGPRLLRHPFGVSRNDMRIVLPTETPGGKSIYHQYTIRTSMRDSLAAFLKKSGISVNVYYPFPLHLQDCFRYLGYRKGDFPETEKACRQVLSLPLFPQMKPTAQKAVIAAIRSFF